MKIYDIDEKKKIDNKVFAEGYKLVAGVDEVGRGSLAGPVVCACVILPKDCDIVGIDDSKKLTEKKREELYEKIIQKAIAYNVEFVSEKVIDEINILNATKRCMEKVIMNMSTRPDIVLVDAVDGLKVNCKTRSYIHGDALSYVIGAGSIVAKVTRDRFMVEMDKKYPEYGFAKNKGYGTKAHMDAIKKYGPCEIHRLSFLGFLNKG